MNKVFLLITFLFITHFSFGQPKTDNVFFKDRLQPLSEENIFKTDAYYIWCSSTIKGENGKYHLFYSR